MDYAPEMKRFPPIELPQEQTAASAVLRENDVVHVAQPCGKRAFMWFTYLKGKNVCFALDIKQKKAANIYPVPAAFHSDLSLGTVLHGTIVQHGGYRCFFIDNLFYWKGVPTDGSYEDKLRTLQEMLREGVDNKICLGSQMLFYMCDYSYCPTAFQSPYKIFCIKCVQLHGAKITNYSDDCRPFLLRRTAVTDTYEVLDLATRELVCIAGVNSYESSCDLKRAFGAPVDPTLDDIEASDDEGAPASVEAEKKFMCRWHPAHKHWVPVCSLRAD